MSLKNSKEDYLRIAYILKKTKNQIRVTDVANELDRSKATVNIALKKLQEDGYLTIQKYGDINLTAKGEVEASKNLAIAAETMAKTPGAMHLRTLSTINDVSSDQSNTLIFCVPIEMLDSFKAGNGNVAKKVIDAVNHNNREE